MNAVQPFTIYPAIDLKDGQCVRLVRGEMESATIFNADPGAQARSWERTGFTWLHVVDLNGAFEGRAVNAEAVSAILKNTSAKVQLGGGIRSRADIERWLEAGITRVILGTIAVKDPDLVRQAAKDFPGRIAVGIDAKAGKVAVQGWAEGTDIAARDLARGFADAGVAAIIYTDVGRDGTGQGLNIAETLRVAEAARPVPVIASGGLAGLDDIRACLMTKGVIQGVIAGRALYDGRLDPAAALALAGG
ncbi:MAG: 1-(5-phosphoribosyl)-5-[(5-phosphoribosylamino)methylideneamino]imidazole-4-carboxamide isomerase [Alphaproteobacteria bacterium]|nr:1-(5-phosphoribosyl)-5-[(5-phosphoribosylamino)methylideneamino]imidazole-4-carboxamide isomerase [Alphaproteobacteria bacterium]